MEDINTITDEKINDSLQKANISLQNDINLILKLINNNKQYLKESIIKSDAFIKISHLVSIMNRSFNSSGLRKFLEDDVRFAQFQRLLHDALVFSFTVVQLS